MAMSQIAMVLIVPAAIFAVGCVLLAAGMRGHRIDLHPLCRRCGFDLIGLPRDGRVCSECGADLTCNRAMCVGHRVRRTGLITVAATLLVPTLFWLGGLTFVATSNIDWIKYKPVWLLLREADANAPSMAELQSRMVSGVLSAGEVDSLVARALAMQADPLTTWNRAWGDCIEHLRSKGSMSHEQWSRYVKQAVVLKVRTRSEIARGDPLWVEASVSELRIGRSWRPDVSLNGISYRIDGRDCGADDFDVSVAGGWRTGRSGTRLTVPSTGALLRPDPAVIEALPNGRRTLSMTYDVQLTPFRNFGNVSERTTARVETTFVLRDRSPPTIELVYHPLTRRAIEVGARARVATYFRAGRLSVQVSLAAPESFDVAYDVFAVFPDGIERELSSCAALRGSSLIAECAGDVGPVSTDVKTIDLVLRPSVDVALKTRNLSRLCDGEIRILSVPVYHFNDRRRARQVNQRDRS